jgi:hypothetical protein
MSTDEVLSPEQRSKFRRILASALVGNMLEFYDLFVYGFLAVVIAKAFFRIRQRNPLGRFCAAKCRRSFAVESTKRASGHRCH